MSFVIIGDDGVLTIVTCPFHFACPGQTGQHQTCWLLAVFCCNKPLNAVPSWTSIWPTWCWRTMCCLLPLTCTVELRLCNMCHRSIPTKPVCQWTVALQIQNIYNHMLTAGPEMPTSISITRSVRPKVSAICSSVFEHIFVWTSTCTVVAFDEVYVAFSVYIYSHSLCLSLTLYFLLCASSIFWFTWIKVSV